MRRIIDITPEQDKSIATLIRESRFESFHHFLSAAVDNQLVLERATSGEPLASVADGQGVKREAISVPEQPIPYLQAVTVEALGEDELYGGGDTDRWLWGQINSVLAIKFSCRESARFLSNGSDMSLQDLGTAVASAAYEFWDYLFDLDFQHDNGRGERLATSFPKRSYGNARAKSTSRFAHQYVGTRRKRDGRYDGALFQLALLGASSDGQPRLTAAGVEFAELSNPVIDNHLGLSGKWLSAEEEDFYLRRVVASSPAERNPVRWAITTVQAGANTRSEMIPRLAEAQPDWSEAEVETYRVGVVSRMVQLRVLNLSRAGRDIRYELGPNADLAVDILNGTGG